MPPDSLVFRFGLPAIALGAAVEGEPFAIMGGLLAQHRSFPLWAAMAAAAGGAWGVDQMWFLIGRWFRSKDKGRLTRGAGYGRALRLFERHPHGFILLFRFAYGIRAFAPVAVGLSSVPGSTYVLLETVAAVVWGMGFTWLGFRYGHLIEQSPYATILWAVSFGALLILTLGAVILRWIKRRREPEAIAEPSR